MIEDFLWRARTWVSDLFSDVRLGQRELAATFSEIRSVRVAVYFWLVVSFLLNLLLMAAT